MRVGRVCRTALLLLLVLVALPARAVELGARDALTGAPVRATIVYMAAGATQRVALDGRLRVIVAPTVPVTATARAPGYHALTFLLAPDAAPTTLLLAPVEDPARFVRLAGLARRAPDTRWLQGWVRRAVDGGAVRGAQVSFEGRHVQTDASGYFELRLASPATPALPRASLVVRAPGLGTYRRDGVLAAAGIRRLVLAVGGSVPRHVAQLVGALDRRTRGVGGALSRIGTLPRLPALHGALLAPGLEPPSSIRVGFADAACTVPCCTGNCGHVCTMPLEMYVRRGLGSEWIASWDSQSLRAGSVAYRSYGAWRVAHPLRASYDICSSACCQVNDSGTEPGTDAATARTAGILLTYDGSAAAASEYSAENNSWDDPNDGLSCSNGDLSCGDGFAGSPAAGWPCLADPVGAGHGCFGHGRGMSQWGSSRWADAGQWWPWIVDHYYNDNGAGSDKRTAVMTSPLSLAGVLAQPAAPAPGDTFAIGASADNAAGATHAHLLVGASLYRSGDGYIDDPAHDAALVLPPGVHAVARFFHVPPGTAAGRHDLLLSLYLDVDENGAISTTDVPLALVTVHDAIEIVTDRIFADAFAVLP